MNTFLTTIIIIIIAVSSLLSSSSPNFGEIYALSTSPNGNNILSYVTTHTPGPNLVPASCHIQADGTTFYCGTASPGVGNRGVTKYGTTPFSLDVTGADIGSTSEFHAGCALVESHSRFVCVHSGTRLLRFYRLSDLDEQVSERLDMSSFTFTSESHPLVYFDNFLYAFGPTGNSRIFRIENLDTTPSIDTSFEFSQSGGLRPRSACLAGTSAANRQIVVQFHDDKMATVDIVGTYPTSNFVELEMVDITLAASSSSESLACSETHAYTAHGTSKIYKHQVIPNLVEVDFLDLDLSLFGSPDLVSLRIFGGGQYMLVSNDGNTAKGALYLLDISGTKFPNHTVIETISDNQIDRTFAAPVIAAPSGTDVRNGGTFKVFAFEDQQPATVFELELKNLDNPSSIVIPPHSFEISDAPSGGERRFCKPDQSRTNMYCTDTNDDVPVRITLEPITVAATGAVNAGAGTFISFCDLGEALSGYYCLYDRGASSDFQSFNIPSLSTRDTLNLATPDLGSAGPDDSSLAFATIGGSHHLFLTDEFGSLFRVDVDGNNLVQASLDTPSGGLLEQLRTVVHCPTDTTDKWVLVVSQASGGPDVAVGRIDGGLSNAGFPAGAYDNHVDLGATFPILQAVETTACSKTYLYVARSSIYMRLAKVSIEPFATTVILTDEEPPSTPVATGGMILSPDSKYLLVGASSFNQVLIYDTSTLTLVETVAASGEPNGRCVAGNLEENEEFTYYCPTTSTPKILKMRLVPYYVTLLTQTKTLSSTTTRTLQSITTTKTTSISASLQSITKTSTKSITASLQSLTSTRTLQSFTRTSSISKSKSLQSLTLTKTVSRTASLQSLTTTISSTTSKSRSKSSSLQSLTQTRSHSASSTLQSLTMTKTTTKSPSLQSLTSTRTVSVSQTLRSLTSTKSISSTASLQSLTLTRSASKSATPFSLTRTLSHTSSATLFSRSKSVTVISPTKSKSLTVSRTRSTSTTPQSLTSTHTLSASSSLQSLTSTKTASASASLQSLTISKSNSRSASLQSLTNTLSRSISSSLQSLTRTITVSTSLSAVVRSFTKTASTSQTVQSLTSTKSISSTASLQSLTLTRSASKSATLLSLTNTKSRSSSVTPFSRSKSLSPFSLTNSVSVSSTKSSTITSSRSNTATGSLQSLSVTLTLFSRSSTLSTSTTASTSATASPPPTLSKTGSLTATNSRSASLQSLTKTKTLSGSLQSLTKTKSKTILVTPPPAATTTTTTSSAPGDNVINNLPPSSNILNALVVSVPSCPSSLTSKCQVRHPQSNECRCPPNTYEQNITLLPSFAFLPSSSSTSQLIDRVGNPCVRNEFTLGICTASTSERYISSYTRFGGTTSENGICEQANPFTNDCSCRVPSTKASFAIATGSPSSLIKKFVTFCLPSNGDLSVFWTIHPDVATSSSTSSNRAEASCVSPNGNVTCECAAGASKTTLGASIFPPDSSSTDPVPGDLTFCKAKPAEPEEEVNLPVTTTGTVVGIVGGFIEGGGANAVVGIQVAALLMTLCDNNPNVSTSGAKSVVVFFEYPGLDPSLGGLAFMLTLTLGVFTLHALLCLLLGFKRFATTEPIEFDPDRIDFFEDEIESPSFLEQIRFASLHLRFPHWSFFVMNIGFSGVVVESTILLQDTESDVNVLVGAIGLVLAIIYIALTLYYSYWGLRSVAPQKLFDIVESDQLQKIKKSERKLKKKLKKKNATELPSDEDEYEIDAVFPRSRSSRRQNRSRQRSQSSSSRNVASSSRNNRSSSSRAQTGRRTKNNSPRSAFTPRSFKGGSSSDDENSDPDSSSSSSSSSDTHDEDGHKWFSRRKSIQPPSSSLAARKRSPAFIEENGEGARSPFSSRRKASNTATNDQRRSSVVEMPQDDEHQKEKEDQEPSKDDSVIVHDGSDIEKQEEGQSAENTVSNNKNTKHSTTKRNPLRAPARPTRKRKVDSDTSSAEDLDEEEKDEETSKYEEGEEEEDTAKTSGQEDAILTEDDKPPHYVKYGKAIQMSAKYCSSAKWFLSEGWWIKFRLYNRRYASMYNSFQPRPTAWAPTTIRLFLFSVSVASSLGGCLIPVTYVGSMALLVAIVFLVARPCRRPFDNILLALQLILGSTLAFSRSSDPELSVRLFYGVIGVTFLYVFHIFVMELLESFSMSNLELDARDRRK